MSLLRPNKKNTDFKASIEVVCGFLVIDFGGAIFDIM